MNQARNIFALLYATLWLACGEGHAQIVLWSDNFETNATRHWIPTSVWHTGSPTGGPPLNGKGFHTHSGAICATTEGYAYNSDGRIYCNVYLSGTHSNLLFIPDASATPTLMFWEWHHFANAIGYVEIKTQTNGWQPIAYFGAGSTDWAQASCDLSAFTGQSIQVGFHFTSGGCCGNGQGWYVDDVSLVATPAPPTLTVPGTQTIFAGQTLVVTNYATNTYLTSDTYTFKLPSPSTNYSITTDGVLTWFNTFTTNGVFNWTNSVSPGTNVISVVAVDNQTPGLSSTNSFTLIILPPPSPIFTGPGTQVIAPGHTLTVTNTVTNTVAPAAIYTFSVKPISTNVLNGVTSIFNSTTNLTINATNGVLTWTNTSAPSRTNLVTIMATDNSHPPLTATNVLAIIISPPPPTLTALGASGTNGFRLTVNTVSNAAWRIDASTNLLNWQPLFTNPAGSAGAVQFTDRLATNFLQRFYRAAFP